jgi:hypothetical protein
MISHDWQALFKADLIALKDGATTRWAGFALTFCLLLLPYKE